MKTITIQKLEKLAAIPDPETELYKLSYAQILELKQMIQKIITEQKDDRLFSMLMRLKSHVMICEDWIRSNEVRRIEKLSSLDEIIAYIAEAEKKEATICV